MARLAYLPYKELLTDLKTRLISRPWLRFLEETRIQVVGLDTSAGPQSVDLAKLGGRLIVIKDETGNATANPITILGTVDNTLNPTISADYGVLRIYANDRVWQSW